MPGCLPYYDYGLESLDCALDCRPQRHDFGKKNKLSAIHRILQELSSG